MQSRHPLRETFLDSELSDSRAGPAATAALSAPTPCCTSGLCSSVRRWFSSLAPDVRSRVAFVFAFLCALAVSAYWLQLTIRSKWLWQQQHPTQVVSYDAVDSLPALFGMQFFFDGRVMPAHFTHLRRVTPFFGSSSGWLLATPFIRCSELTIGGLTYDAAMPSSLFCESINADGSFVLNPANAPPGELDGSSARALPLSAWPLQFTQGFGQDLCFFVDVLLNRTGMLSDGFDAPPMFTMLSLSSSAMLTLRELAAAGLAVQSVISRNDYQIVSFLPFGSIYPFRTTTTRTVQVSGDTDYVYEYQPIGTTLISPSEIRWSWQQVLNGTQDATQRATLQALKDDPSSLYATATVCARPRSFIVEEIALFHTYGWSSFLSDCGGFLSILSIVFVALFPLTVRVTRARDFLPIWLVKRFRKEKDGADAGADAAGEVTELRAMQPSITVEP